MTTPTTKISPSTTIPLSTQPGVSGRALSRQVQPAGNAPAKSLLEKAVSPIGRGLVGGAHEQIEQLLFKQAPQEIIELKDLIEKAIHSTDTLTLEDIENINARLALLAADDCKLLKQLAPAAQQELKLFKDHISSFFKDQPVPDRLDRCKRKINRTANKKHLQQFHEFLHVVLKQNQGALAHSLENLQKALLSEENGLLIQAVDTLKRKCQENFLDDKEGLLPKTLALVQERLQQNLKDLENWAIKPDGAVDKVVDTLRHRVLDTDGLLDQLLKQLDGQLNDEEKGLLSHTKKFLSHTMTDLIDLLNQKLREKDGPLDYLEFRLNDKEGGILANGMKFLKERLDSEFNALDQKLTEQAHILLSKSYDHIRQLRQAVVEKRHDAIQKNCEALRPLLGQLITYEAAVFSKLPLEANDRVILIELYNRLPNFYSVTPPAEAEMLMTVEAGIHVLKRYYGVHAGILERSADVFTQAITQKVEPLLTRVENLPSTMLGNLMGKSQPGEGTLPNFLAYGSSLLKGLLDTGGKAVSHQALLSCASVLTIGLKQALAKMEGSEAFNHPRRTVAGIISTLEHMQNNSTEGWGALQTYLEEAAQALSEVKVYIDGFRVPIPTKTTGKATNAETAHSDNLAILQQAINTTPPPPENRDWKTLAQEEKNKLVSNTTRFLTIKHIFEDVCRLRPPDETFYLQLLAKANEKGDKSDSELEKLFFEELHNKNVGFITRMYAKIQYYFYGTIVKRFTERASTIYFNEIFKYIDEHKAENFETLRNQLIENFTRYLTILGGAYRTVGTNPTPPRGTLEEMLKVELEKKDANLGFETKELYLKFAETVLKKTTGSSMLTWVAKLFIGDPEVIVRAVVDKATSSLQGTQGYTHALNTVIREQLEEVWRMLQNSDPQEQGSALNPDLSTVKKAQLASLVKNLFEVLSKSQCRTLDELRDLVEGKLLSARVYQAVDDLFIEDILEKVTHILAITIQSLVKEDQLQKLTYKFANLANRSFEVGTAVTLAQMQDEERQIAKLSERVLSRTINQAVEDKFDLSGKKQQNETNHYIQELHQSSTAYFASTEQKLRELMTMDVASREASNKMSALVEEALAYETDCYHSSFQAKGSNISSDNKNEINERYRGIAEESKPFIEAIATMKQHATALEHIQTAAPYLNQVRGVVTGIYLELFTAPALNLDLITHAENRAVQLQSHLEQLKKISPIAEQVQAMAAVQQKIAETLVHLRKAVSIRTFSAEQIRSNSLLEQIAAEKKRCLTSHADTAQLKGKIANLRGQLMLFVQQIDTALLPQLLEKLTTIEEATLAQQVDTAHQELTALLRQAMDQANRAIEAQKQTNLSWCYNIEAAIQATHFLDPSCSANLKKAITDSIALAAQKLHQLRTWESETIKEIGYINFANFDLKGLQDWAAGLVYSRVRERLDGLIDFVKREETYRYGLNHLFLVPYLKTMQKQKKS